MYVNIHEEYRYTLKLFLIYKNSPSEMLGK